MRPDLSLNNRVRSCISLQYSKGRSFGDVIIKSVNITAIMGIVQDELLVARLCTFSIKAQSLAVCGDHRLQQYTLVGVQ